ncbi:alginate lyase family protein [Roseomonas elaeocarpi]|uniref:Alginate lyase family protein n=1 Tax=Roseomonas elaeocarpi TaxID=907779 RepID=A0ABV6JUI4_9PROT
MQRVKQDVRTIAVFGPGGTGLRAAARAVLPALLLLALPGFAVAKVPDALRAPFAPLPNISHPATACPTAPEPQRFIEGVSFYADPKFSRPDAKRLEADREIQKKFDLWLDAIQAAVDRRRTGERGAAACALTLLDSWAKAGALAGAVNWQGSYHRIWALAGAGIAFLQIRDAEGLDQTAAGRVGRWMKEVAALIRPDYDRESRAAISDARNNQSAWAGLAVAVAGIAGGDRELLDWGVARLRAQLAQVTPEGALPQELARGPLALHYHLFALQPIAALERLAAANNIALTPAETAALERLTRFTLAAAQDPKRINELAHATQKDFWLDGKPPLTAGAGLDLRAQAAPQAELDAALQPFRPYRERWLGGLVTGLWSPRRGGAATVAATPPGTPQVPGGAKVAPTAPQVPGGAVVPVTPQVPDGATMAPPAGMPAAVPSPAAPVGPPSEAGHASTPAAPVPAAPSAAASPPPAPAAVPAPDAAQASPVPAPSAPTPSLAPAAPAMAPANPTPAVPSAAATVPPAASPAIPAVPTGGVRGEGAAQPPTTATDAAGGRSPSPTASVSQAAPGSDVPPVGAAVAPAPGATPPAADAPAAASPPPAR